MGWGRLDAVGRTVHHILPRGPPHDAAPEIVVGDGFAARNGTRSIETAATIEVHVTRVGVTTVVKLASKQEEGRCFAQGVRVEQ